MKLTMTSALLASQILAASLLAAPRSAARQCNVAVALREWRAV